VAYYRGDYYRGKGRGDYYRGGGRGDPGFWSTLGRIGGSIFTAYTGIPLGGLTSGGTSTTIATPPFTPGSSAFTRVPRVEQITLQKLPAERPLPELPSRRVPGSRDVIYGQEMGVFRRRRRMNPGNVKALRRSLRRVSSFGRLCRSARKAIGQAASAVQVRRGAPMRRPLPARR